MSNKVSLFQQLLFITLLLFTLQACQSSPQFLFSDEEEKLCEIEYSKYQATVTGYCQEPLADLVQDLPREEKSLEIRPIETIPEVFWFNREFQYSFVKQPNKAPLIFVIAGTGAKHDSAKMISLQKVLYAQGYHVIALSSPTFANFIVNATTKDDIPGYLAKDAETLYEVMQKTYQQVKTEEEIEVSHFELTGYSLGGAHSAFVSFLDEKEKVFNFKNVLLINPPVSLYSSASILDGYLDLANDRENVTKMFNRVFDKFAESYNLQETSEFNSSNIYKLFKHANLSEEELKLLIGTSFRVSSADMLFAIDATYNVGAVIYRNHDIGKFESVTHSMKRAYNVTFLDYFEKGMVPWAKEQDSSKTRAQLIFDFSLRSLDSYLRRSEKISMVTNADDIILAKGELAYLQDVFGDRAKVFERGGHCGNIDRVNFVHYLKQQFKGGN
ncbi:alpha/beta hydrolase [Thalassotalea marina]|uniref:Alpha/beta hydrolase n=1 Tax=Thalassotalea marina TaxID=1673741 RepID=A0A919B9P7_9GAMM|nr:alpha/beta hydrolase [Thalassotalea marina]GHF77363.1 hypothetical protein GCM10017161_00410 [Thalassotalea marina]